MMTTAQKVANARWTEANSLLGLEYAAHQLAACPSSEETLRRQEWTAPEELAARRDELTKCAKKWTRANEAHRRQRQQLKRDQGAA